MFPEYSAVMVYELMSMKFTVRLEAIHTPARVGRDFDAATAVCRLDATPALTAKGQIFYALKTPIGMQRRTW